MTIDILTSYKGGVGKTTIALSIALNCIDFSKDKNGKTKMKLKKNFVLIDTNPQNSNLAEDIFFYFHANSRSNSPYINQTGTKYTISPDSDFTFSVYDATDQDPFALARRLQMEDNSDTCYIIDTNVHVRSIPSDIFSGEGYHKVFVWFLWGWSSPRLTHQLEAILQSAESIERSWPKVQMIHVFNLYDFFTGGLVNLSLKKANTTLKPLKAVLKKLDRKLKKFDKGVCNPVYIGYKTLGKFAKDIHTTLIGYVAGDNLSMEELPNLWAEHLDNMVDRAGKTGYPYNILIIPTFFRELTMSTDRLIMSSPRSFEKIIGQIAPMAEFIETFLYALDRCVDVEKACNVCTEETT
jgi:hypothetical protein